MEEQERGIGLEDVAGAVTPSEETVYVLGSPPIREFMEFVKNRAAHGTCAREDVLAEEWRRAESRLSELETAEGGFADDAPLIPLPESMTALANLELQEPSVQRSLGPLRCKWSIVCLDKMIVHQRAIVLPYVRSCSTVLRMNPTDEELFLLAAGRLWEPPQVRVTRESENVYTFASLSTDLRCLEVANLDSRAVYGYSVPGRAARIVGAVVGFGLNYLSALRMQGRLILNNGTHRACMLLGRDIREAPCFVRDVSSVDDLDLIGASDIRQNLQLYLRARRPPRLRDFADPQLRKVIPVTAATRLIRVQISTERSRVSLG